MRLLCFIGYLLTLKTSAAAIQAQCVTETSGFLWSEDDVEVKTCFPDINEVGEENFTILSARDPTTLGFRMKDKKGVKFLPTNLSAIFPELIAFDGSRCAVRSISENHFRGLSKLKVMKLPFNQIEHISKNAFIDLSSLEELELALNKIKSLDENTFASQTALKTLHLTGNEIQSLHPKIFDSLVNVKTLMIHSNKIGSFDENIFDHLASLKVIMLSGNEMQEIPKNLFKNNFGLENISLGDDETTFIDANFFDHLSNLKYVTLSGNLCATGFYPRRKFDLMKSALKQNCTEKLTH